MIIFMPICTWLNDKSNKVIGRKTIGKSSNKSLNKEKNQKPENQQQEIKEMVIKNIKKYLQFRMIAI